MLKVWRNSATVLARAAAVAAVLIAAGCLDGNGGDRASSPGERDIATYLLTDAAVRSQFPDLTRKNSAFSDGDEYSSISASDLSGPTIDAAMGVHRQWGQPTSWSAGDPPPDEVAGINSSAFAFSSPEAGSSAAEEVLELARTRRATHLTREPFHGTCEGETNDVVMQSCVAVAAIDDVLVALHVEFAGVADAADSFLTVLDAASSQVGP